MNRSIKSQDARAFVMAYREALLWAAPDDDDGGGDGLIGPPVAPSADRAIEANAARFMAQHADDLITAAEDIPWSLLGHRFAMTQQETGCSFLDDGSSPALERLESSCGLWRDYPPFDLYTGDDRRVHILGHEGQPHE